MRNKYLPVIVLVVVFFAVNFRPVENALASLLASTYYVNAGTGSDTNACSVSAPCKTISKGLTVAASGDTVYVSAGIYPENVAVSKAIQLIGNNAIIDGSSLPIPTGEGLVTITASNATVQGLEVRNAKKYGVAVYGSNNQILSNLIHNIADSAIWVRDSSHNLFENNEVYNSVLNNSVSFDGTHYTCSPTKTAWPSAINPWGTASYNTWRGNNIHDNCGEGLVLYSYDVADNNTLKDNWSVEIYIDQHVGVTVKNNTIIDTKPYAPRGSDQSWRAVPSGIAIADETACAADSNTISGNNVTGSRYGFSFYAYVACSGIKNSVIENNTFTNVWEYGLRILSGSHVNSVIRNNTIRLTSGRPLTIQSAGFTVTGNTFFSNTNVFEWIGKTYNFTSWSAVAPGNFWSMAGTTVPTVTATATPTFTVTAIPPTATRTATVIPTVTVVPPTTTPSETAVPVVTPQCFDVLPSGMICYYP